MGVTTQIGPRGVSNPQVCVYWPWLDRASAGISTALRGLKEMSNGTMVFTP